MLLFRFNTSARPGDRTTNYHGWEYSVEEIGGVLWWKYHYVHHRAGESISVTWHGSKFLPLGNLNDTFVTAVQAEILTGLDRAVALDRLREMVHEAHNPFEGMTHAQA